jgi:SHS2 domain-containing protein
MAYKYLDHTADVKFIAEGNTTEEAFIECTRALKDSICGGINIIPRIEKKIEIQDTNLENILYKFLEEFLILLDSESFLFSEVSNIKIDSKSNNLKARVKGDRAENYKFTNNVKAITYSQMQIKKSKDKVTCTVVLDV